MSTRSGHAHCLLCGDLNPWSLGLQFFPGDGDKVFAKFQARSELQGYDGILHGGVIAALLDAAMTHCLFHRGIEAVTGDLRVRFLQPVPCSSSLALRAQVRSARPPLYYLRAELLHEARVMAWAEAKFMQRQANKDSLRELSF